MTSVDEKRNQFNLEIRMLLAVIDMIDGQERKYPDYNSKDNMNENDFLDQQLMLVREAKEKLISIFKD